MNNFGSVPPSQPSSPPSPQSSIPSSTSPQSKTRKPYTITKQRENWTDEEHSKFLEALTLYDRDWKKIEAFVGSKTVIQIRSHAQKYFLKVQKTNSGERIPPPRPKRKSVQPYPQKPKQEPITIPWVTTPDSVAVNPFLNNPAAFAHWMASNGLMPASASTHRGSDGQLTNDMQRQQQEQLQQAQHYLQQAMSAAQQTQRGTSQGRPNFSKIYSFLGSLFDPTASNYIEALNDMSPIDRETVQLLMHNLAVNLANQQFRDQHSLLLDQYRTLLSKAPTEHTSTPSMMTAQQASSHAPPSSSHAAPYLSMTANKDDFRRSGNTPIMNIINPTSFLDMNSGPGYSIEHQNRIGMDHSLDNNDYSSDEEPQIDEGDC
jgi:SHAQKYF class myb-like DNA-binding protein